MCFRHKWKYVRKYYEDEFEGVKFKNHYSPYRICIKCGRAEELEILPFSGDISWMKLSPLKSEILKQIVKDEGDYFKLMEQAERAEEVFKESFSEKFGWERSKR